MILSKEGHVMGMGTAPELAVDTLGVIASIMEDEEHDLIIEKMLECEMDCGTNTLTYFATTIIDVLQGISGQ